MEDEIECTPEEHDTRLEFCKSCPAFHLNEQMMTECNDCGCSISLLTTYKFKTCPRGNWE